MKRYSTVTHNETGAKWSPEIVNRLVAWAIAMSAFAVLCVMLATTAPAQTQTQTQCGSRMRIVAALAGKYGEAPKAIGAIGSQRVLEVYASDVGSWTILVTTTNGSSCIIASGDSWEDVPFKPGAQS